MGPIGTHDVGIGYGLLVALKVGIEEAKRGEFVYESFGQIIGAAQRENSGIYFICFSFYILPQIRILPANPLIFR